MSSLMSWNSDSRLEAHTSRITTGFGFGSSFIAPICFFGSLSVTTYTVGLSREYNCVLCVCALLVMKKGGVE